MRCPPAQPRSTPRPWTAPALLLSAALASSCGAAARHVDAAPGTPDPPAGEARYAVSFHDRTIDLEPYVQGFPYSGFDLSAADGYALWFHTDDEGQHLRYSRIADAGSLDPAEGRVLTGIDWSTRSWWGAELVPARQTFFVWADEANEERMNIYELDPASGSLEALTHNDYTYGFGVSDDATRLVYVARNGDGEPYNSCLHSRSLADDTDRQLYCDGGGEDRLTWTGVELNPAGTAALVSIQHDGDRNRGNIALFGLDAEFSAPELLLPRAELNYSVWVVEHSFSDDTFLYVSSVSGFDELYSYDLSTRTSTQLTSFDEDISSLVFVPGDEPLVLLTRKRPHETELTVVAPTDGTVIHTETLAVAASLYDAWGDTAYLHTTSVDSPFGIQRLRWGRIDGTFLLAAEPFAGLPEDLGRRIVHCQTTRVAIPTFDTLPDGSQRTLHAFWSVPRNPPADSTDRLARIVAFYGGENSFSNGTQILCEAGIATLSPAPRGSWGFGAAFAALNDGDLGGDEIIDLFYAARWLEQEHHYTSRQIGVAGGSHGGYATMRALTFPPDTNGRGASYPFGFGLSHAGFSDIAAFWAACNIPDWVVLEAGDPVTDADKLRDRSPLTHVDLLEAPLLLTHGTNDQRVPVEGSRDFAAAATALGRPVTYVEFAGQGHGIEGLDNTLAYYRAVFGFLDGVRAFWEARGEPR